MGYITDKISFHKVINPNKPTMAIKHLGAEQAARGRARVVGGAEASDHRRTGARAHGTRGCGEVGLAGCSLLGRGFEGAGGGGWGAGGGGGPP